jgi:hypothetical protein
MTNIKCGDNACINNGDGICTCINITLEMQNIEEDLLKNAELRCQNYEVWRRQ